MLSKNCLKRYVFNSLLKPVKDGDLRKSNGSMEAKATTKPVDYGYY